MQLAPRHHGVEQGGRAGNKLVIVGQNARFKRMINGQYVEVANAAHAQYGGIFYLRGHGAVTFCQGQSRWTGLNVRQKCVSGGEPPETWTNSTSEALHLGLGNHWRVVHGALHRGKARRADNLVDVAAGHAE